MADEIPAGHPPVKHSVTIAGHRTSISLEEPFWVELRRIASERGQSLNGLVTAVDEARAVNLSSALRTLVVEDLKRRRDTPSDHSV